MWRCVALCGAVWRCVVLCGAVWCDTDSPFLSLSVNSKYEKYLEGVREANPDEYAEIPDLLNRYQTLEDANADLKMRQVGEETREDKRECSAVRY